MALTSKLDKARRLGPLKGFRVGCNLLLRKTDNALNRSRLLSSPTSIQLEPTTKCNLRCKFCISHVWDRRGMDMSFPDFKVIVDKFPCLCEIHMQGIGEPLLARDFFLMLEYCRKKRIKVSTITNATLLDKSTAEKLVDSGIDTVTVSMDGACKEVFESIRVGADFDKVVSNLRGLVAARGRNRKPRITINFTGSAENISELPALLRLAKDVGVDAVSVFGVHFWVDDLFRERFGGKSLAENLDLAKKVIDESISLAGVLGLDLEIVSGGGQSSGRRCCPRVFGSVFVTVDGFVTTCPDVPDPRKVNYGNLLRDSFSSVWNCPGYVSLRRDRLSGCVPAQCRGCGGHSTIR